MRISHKNREICILKSIDIKLANIPKQRILSSAGTQSLFCVVILSSSPCLVFTYPTNLLINMIRLFGKPKDKTPPPTLADASSSIGTRQTEGFFITFYYFPLLIMIAK